MLEVLGYIYIYIYEVLGEKFKGVIAEQRNKNKKIENCLKSINLALRFSLNHLVFVTV